jgi:glycogen(starch) synthase
MRILIWSSAFHPSIGGLEATSHMLAEEFDRNGHQVTVVTRTPSTNKDECSFEVVRRPHWRQMFQLVRACDVYLQNHISVTAAWPLLLLRRPWVVTHHTWIERSGMRGFIKHFVLRFARSISCSNDIAAGVKAPSTVIGSPYDDRVFQPMPEVRREKDLIFVGRLSREKGAHILLDALRLLKAEGVEPGLTVVGEGPERDKLAQQTHDLGIGGQVTFEGSKESREIAVLLNQHRILAVPSAYREPFGIVALEGIACGCVVVGSEGGGLKDVIGPCGATFPNGDSSALASCLAIVLRERDTPRKYQDRAAVHLRSFTRATVARSYLKVLESSYASINS